ncbi:MAG: hypothetical protein IJX77_06205 [Ruminococcus sp.]|nr:hypothetical protein [Ruminococcus sp.]
MIYEIKYLSAQRRYRHNSSLERFAEDEYINGQALGAVSRMRYGLCRMSFNGCGSIAVYNALLYLGQRQRLCDIAVRLERYRMLFGVFGCNPKRLGRVLMQYGIDYEQPENPDEAQAFIISFWTGRRFMSSIHTVFGVRKNNDIRIYNRYNNSPEVYHYKSLEALTKGRKPVAFFAVEKQSARDNT